MSEKIVFGYVRVSGAAQADKDGPVRQEEAIKQFCEIHKMPAAQFPHADLGVSGTIEGLDRPGLVKLLGEATELTEAGHEVSIVVEKMDRFARDLIVSELLMRELRTRKISLYAADNGPVEQTTLDTDPGRKLIRQIFGALAEYDKSSLVMKLRVARERVIKEKGKCGGKRAFGVDSPNVSGNSERILLNLIAELLAAGSSWRAIAVMFNANGVKNRNGVTGKWTHVQLLRIWQRHQKRKK